MIEYFKKIGATIDFMTDRYTVSVLPGDQAAECLKLRKQVFGEELKRVRPEAAFSPAAPDVFDPVSEHGVVTDTRTDEVVGCLRLTNAARMVENPLYKEEYRMDLVPEDILRRTVVLSRFVMRKSHRRSSASLTLLLHLFEHAIDSGYILSLITCEAALYPLYRRIGYRPLAPIHISPFGGYRVPLFLVGHDYDHLKTQKSPFYGVIKRREFPVETRALEWHRENRSDFIDSGFTILPDAGRSGHSNLVVDGMSEAGKTQILKNAVLVQCNYGDKIIVKGGGERNFGFVQKGGLQIKRKGVVVAILGQGDLFGELSFMLDIPRTADAAAASDDTEVVFLSLSSIGRLTDPRDQAVLWRNIAHVLAHRIAARF